jgi:hypothetical protein
VNRRRSRALLWIGVPISTDEVTAALGARVRSLQRERGWTLKQLGHAAGLSHPFLSQLEEGDALMLDGGVPHRLRRTGGVSTRALKVATPA